MIDLLVRKHAPDSAGVVTDVTPASAHWGHVGFRVQQLAEGQSALGGEPGREVCLVILSGAADVKAGALVMTNLGGRGSVFDDEAPGAVYAPAGVTWTVTATTPVELAVCSAPSTGKLPARPIPPETDDARGAGAPRTNTRYVRNILPETEPADSLLVVEVITPGGNWSSYPPHKHDTATPGRRDRARGKQLPSPQSSSGLCLPASLHRRP